MSAHVTPPAHVSVYRDGDLVFVEWVDRSGVSRRIPFKPEHAIALARELEATAS